MDHRQFEYVTAIAEEKSFSKAARRLFISQPSLSQYIGRLEESLGVSLFDRTASPLALTPEGELFIETALKIIGLNEQMLKTFDDMGKMKKGRLNIGLTPSKACHPLPSILPVFKNKYPDIDLYITEAASAQLEELLHKGLVDICIMNLPIDGEAIEGLTMEAIMTEKIFLAAPPGHSVNTMFTDGRPRIIDIGSLADKQFILLHPDQRLRQITNNIFTKAGIKPKILLETRSIETALRLSAAGMGFTFVPEACALYTGLIHIPAYYSLGSPPLTWTLGLIYRNGSYITKAAQAFADVTKEVIKTMYRVG